METFYFDYEGMTYNADTAAKAGFVQTDDHTKGFLTRGDLDYCEQIAQIKVTSCAVDGPRKPRVFTTFAGAAKYVCDEEWTNDGGVSTDGITRLCGISCKGIASHYFSDLPAVRMIVMAMARGLSFDEAFNKIITQPLTLLNICHDTKKS
jgi:hypothetical protein